MLRTACDIPEHDKQLQEIGLNEPTMLQNLELGHFAHVRIISIDSTIVCDVENPNVWKLYSDHLNQVKKDRELDILEELEEDQVDIVEGNDAPACSELAREAARNIILDLFQVTPATICSIMLSFLNNYDLCNIVQVNRHVKDLCLRNDYFRYRKKEQLSTNGALAARISKEKKIAKKKKSKEAFIPKVEKRDAFARGIAR